ncbi:MAG: ATP-dependent RecD-like DNA helicase [Desulfocapsa sp.]|nr:MAG: ATP-dependent RecD-like DNA helicase [Desulfocapsa sp.]
MSRFKARITRIVFKNEDFAILAVSHLTDEEGRIPTLNKYSNVTVQGGLSALSEGQLVTFEGIVKTGRYGEYLECHSYTVHLPSNRWDIEKTLASGFIPEIGDVLAYRIAMRFGEDTWDVLDNDIDRLLEVEGIGAKKLEIIKEGYAKVVKMRELMKWLSPYGISTALVTKIYKKWKEKAESVLKYDPYKLVEIRGIGFRKADEFALNAIGLARNDDRRIQGGVLHALSEALQDGNVFLPKNKLQAATEALFASDETIDAFAISNAIEKLIFKILQNETVTFNGADIEAVYLAHSHTTEITVASRLTAIINEPGKVQNAQITWAKEFKRLEDKMGFALGDKQKVAVQNALKHKVSVITGGPGVGKTTTLLAITDILQQQGFNIMLAAPTGMAAKRMEEATGMSAKTIHRLLGATDLDKFAYGIGNKLEGDYLIVDEMSMVTQRLMSYLLEAVPDNCHILLVGDIDQLPSVGAGNVFKDIIESGTVPVTRLNEIFRQAQESAIVLNAHKINTGQTDLITRSMADERRDWFQFVYADTERLQQKIVDIVSNEIPMHFGYEHNQIQVLSPMYRGNVGVNALNKALQERLNPPAPHKFEKVTASGIVWRVGDRVMQLRNNYDTGIMNGTVGVIKSYDPLEKSFVVKFDNSMLAKYSASNMRELRHAYAVTIHKVQGNEFPVVVIVMHTTHYIMLQRNLFYTGVTRAKDLVVVVGNTGANDIAIANNKVATRYSALSYRLQKLLK